MVRLCHLCEDGCTQAALFATFFVDDPGAGRAFVTLAELH